MTKTAAIGVESVEFFTGSVDTLLPIFSSDSNTIPIAVSKLQKGVKRLSIEEFLLMNFLMDTLLLFLALRAVGSRLTLRIFAGAAAGALYALLASLCGGWLLSMPCQAAALLMMAMIADGRVKIRPALLISAAASAALMGGVMTYASRYGSGQAALLCALAAALAACMLQDRRRMDLSEIRIRLRIGHGGATAEFTAFVDTGNRLKEPLSGLPVLIVESRLLAGIAPESRRPTRRIPYAGLGGTGFLRAFRPELLQRQDERGWQSVAQAWVAVYPGRMSGSIHALAPPSFALTARSTVNIREERFES